MASSDISLSSIEIEQSKISAQPWLLSADRAGFFGKYALGLIYQFSIKHEVALSVGVSSTGNTYYGQINTAYRYAPWLFSIEPNTWKPLQIGFFAVYSLNDGDYFFNSPSGYPTPDYYDRTDLRLGLDTGTTFVFEKTGIELSYRLRVLDLGFVALYNNAHRDLQYYISSGLEFHYRF